MVVGAVPVVSPETTKLFQEIVFAGAFVAIMALVSLGGRSGEKVVTGILWLMLVAMVILGWDKIKNMLGKAGLVK